MLVVNKSNTNEIKEILGSPSTKSKFDNDVWIYIERQQTQSEFKNLGKMKISKNDVLVLEIDQYKKSLAIEASALKPSGAASQKFRK